VTAPGDPVGGVQVPAATRPIWETRSEARRNVTFPARQYSVNGERRSFALLRPISDAAAHDRMRDLVLEAYASYEAELTQTA
jgi:hypothetical protein